MSRDSNSSTSICSDPELRVRSHSSFPITIRLETGLALEGQSAAAVRLEFNVKKGRWRWLESRAQAQEHGSKRNKEKLGLKLRRFLRAKSKQERLIEEGDELRRQFSILFDMAKSTTTEHEKAKEKVHQLRRICKKTGLLPPHLQRKAEH